MIDELAQLSATKLAGLMRARRVSPVEVVEAYLRRIERINPAINAIITLAPDALDRAREAEAALMRGEDLGALHGLPVTIKDTIETSGLRTTSGSVTRANHVPAENATAVTRLMEAGAIVLGKTNVSEMAIPYECDNPLFGRTNNPHDTSRTSGGSSGGEAAAISACLSPVGLGSDLSGSIRVPAHFCGIVGLKPTTGAVSCAGHFPPADGPLALGAAVGPIARYVEDAVLLIRVLMSADGPGNPSGTDAGYKHAGRSRVAKYLDDVNVPVTSETREAVDTALRILGEAGFEIVEEKPPGLERAAALWPPLFSEAATIQLEEVYRGHESDAGAVVRAVLSSAKHATLTQPDALEHSFASRAALLSALDKWMETTPLIIAPIGSTPAFEHGSRRVTITSTKEISVFRAFSYSRGINALGLPSVSLPVGRSPEGLPIGVQIIGRPFEEEAVLNAASIIEEALGGWIRPSV